MDDRESPDPLKDLGARIDKAYDGRGRPGRDSGPDGGSAKSALAIGMRIGLELVVAVGVGAGAGYLLDRWLGTRPWGMVGCFFLGVAAGMVNVYRTVTGLGMAAGYGTTGSRTPRAPQQDWDEE